MLWSAANPIFASNYVADLHLVVVDHICGLIGRPTVRLEEDMVVQNCVFEGDLTAQAIDESRGSFNGRRESDNRRQLNGVFGSAFGVCKIATFPVITRRLLERALFLTHLFKALGGAIAMISFAGFQEVVYVTTVQIQPLGLNVGAEWPSDTWTFVPVDAQPTKAIQDGLLRPRNHTSLIGVFDA